MGVYILVLGLIAMVIGGPILTTYYYRKNNPIGYYAGQQPEPNGKDVPRWSSGIALFGWALFIIGIILLIINQINK